VSAWREPPSAIPAERFADVHFGTEVFAVGGTELGDYARGWDMITAPHRCKILAHMFRRVIRNLDQIQNSSTAQACAFDQSKIDTAKDAIHDVIEELEARADRE
jgi:hypothetical protein